MTFQLVRYDVAKRAIADLVSVDEVKDWRDKALAIQAYAVQAKDKQMEVDAAEHRFRCERRLGELLADSGAGSQGRRSDLVVSGDEVKPTLSDLGISRDLSSRAQAIATIPEDGFEAELAAHRCRGGNDWRSSGSLTPCTPRRIDTPSGSSSHTTPPETSTTRICRSCASGSVASG